jgi:MFS family permease
MYSNSSEKTKNNPYKDLFTNLNFLKLWISQLFSQLSANLLNFALIIRVFDLAAGTKYASISVSLLVLAFGVPSIIFALLAGAYVDHLDRKKVLVITNVFRALLVLMLLFFDNNLLVIYLLVFMISVFSQFFIPAEAAAMPRLVKKRDLTVANSFFLFTLYGSFAVGYALAGPVISSFGQNAVYWLASGAFMISALLCLTLPRINAELKGINISQINKQVMSMIGQTTKKILSTPKLSFPILNLSIIQMMIGVIAVIAPALSIALFNQSLAVASTKIIIPISIGMLFGAFISGYILRKSKRVITIDLGIGVAVLILVSSYFLPRLKSIALYIPIIILGVFILGIAVSMISVTAQTLLQVNSSDEERGKIFGMLNMMMNIAATIPVLIAGIVADIVSPLAAISIAGMVIGIFGIYQFLTIRRHEAIYKK